MVNEFELEVLGMPSGWDHGCSRAKSGESAAWQLELFRA